MPPDSGRRSGVAWHAPPVFSDVQQTGAGAADMANNRRRGMQVGAALALAVALVAGCTNGGKDEAEPPRDKAAGERRRPAPAPQRGDQMAASPDEDSDGTTTVPEHTPVTGRQLLRANRVRFTRPLPPSTPATTVPGVTTASTVPVTPPTTVPDGGSDTDELRPSQELIAADYEKGEISWSRSMLYRAYALFFDPRLPPQYDGLGSTGEDDFFTEARLRFDQLDTDVQALIAPFLERPAADDGYGCPIGDAAWQHSGGASATFKVWACATGDHAADIEAVRAQLDTLYAEMGDPTAMGPLVRDGGTAADGGDDRIDVYLLDNHTTRPRNGAARPIDGETIAAVSETGPFVDGTASSYLMIGRPHLDDAVEMRRTLVHELFHGLQYSHDFAVRTTDPAHVPWFFEASAAWAEWQYADARAAVHQDYFVNAFGNTPDLPLELPRRPGAPGFEFRQPLGAYLWPLFMQQEAGGDPTPVFDAWRSTDGTADWNDFHAAVDAQLPYADWFRDFAVRNLNIDMGPAVGPGYDALDPAFPSEGTPKLTLSRVLSAPGATDVALGPDGRGLRPLSTQYDRLTVDPASGIRSLTLDFTGLEPAQLGSVSVLLRTTNGGWSRHDQRPDARFGVCFDDPDGAVEELYVVTANHQRVLDWRQPDADVLAGAYAVTAAADCHAADAIGSRSIRDG